MSAQVPTPEMVAAWENDRRIHLGTHELRYVHRSGSWSVESWFHEPYLLGGAVFRREADAPDADTLPWGWLIYTDEGVEEVLGETATLEKAMDCIFTFYTSTTTQEHNP